jgi:hypothetical protein
MKSATKTATPARTDVAATSGDDAEIFALATEIGSLEDAAEDIQTRRVEPFDTAFYALARIDFKEAAKFSDMIGREGAIGEIEDLNSRCSLLFEQMAAMPTHTQAGRAAKVRTLLTLVGDKWRGTGTDLDWDLDMARKLLGAFAGMTEGELAAI